MSKIRKSIMLAIVAETLATIVWAQDFGEFFVHPSRGQAEHRFTYWESFTQPYDAPNFARQESVDLAGNGSDYNDNVTITQTEPVGAFVTGSGSIYSHSGSTAFDIEYFHGDGAPVTGIVCQFQTGGATIDLDRVTLTYQSVDADGQPVEVSRRGQYRTFHEPGLGGFSDRVASGAEWVIASDDLPVGDFVIHLESPAPSMPIYAAQLDVSSRDPYQSTLGYLLGFEAKPEPRHGRPLMFTSNNPGSGETRFFRPGETVEITAVSSDPEAFYFVGWAAPDSEETGATVSYVFGGEDYVASALYAPLSYDVWRETMFYHYVTTGSEEDYVEDGISGETADPDRDGFNNLMEYALGGDPYVDDARNLSPQIARLDDGTICFTHRRWRLPANLQSTQFVLEGSTDLKEWNVVDGDSSNTQSQDNGDGTETVSLRLPSGLNPRFHFFQLSVQHN